jgi:hypothetical protein
MLEGLSFWLRLVNDACRRENMACLLGELQDYQVCYWAPGVTLASQP